MPALRRGNRRADFADRRLYDFSKHSLPDLEVRGTGRLENLPYEERLCSWVAQACFLNRFRGFDMLLKMPETTDPWRRSRDHTVPEANR
jgi:hypothetical protein